MIQVLLVDDDPVIRMLVDHGLGMITSNQYQVTYESRCHDALVHVNRQAFDLILLDNRLSKTVTAKATVPLFRRSRFKSPIAIISSDISEDYLSNPSILGVDYIVDKKNLMQFLKDQVALSELLSTKEAI
ncbi:MAG: response regulator [Pseudomonadota bacterium]